MFFFILIVMHSNGRHGESPRHKTPIEYWVETLRKTGTGKAIVSDMYSTSSCLIMMNHMSVHYMCYVCHIKTELFSRANVTLNHVINLLSVLLHSF